MNNREIKFRIWDKTCKFMYYPEDTGTAEFIKINLYGDPFVGNIPMDWCEIMQFTSITDKNYKDIYEGDIVTYVDDSGKIRRGIVEWETYKWIIKAIGGDEEGNQDGEIDPGSNITIIGNIFEDPELLGDQSNE